MLIEKIINNNIVSAVDSKGREVVVMGRGLGFGMKPGRQIQENKIEKVFRIKSQTLAEQFKDLEKKIKSAGVAGVIRPGKTSVQVIIGTKVQFVADEFKKLCK